MTMTDASPVTDNPVGQRGPQDHARREQIIQAADEHFRRYGYRKTSVGDLAKAIGVSSAYVYRFFESKQAIGEAVCAMVLGSIDQKLMALAANSSESVAQRLRDVCRAAMELSYELFFSEERLHEIVIEAVSSDWHSVKTHTQAIHAIMSGLVEEGRVSGEFERKTPIDEVVLAIYEAMTPFCHPLMLQLRSRENLDRGVVAVISLILRSLAP